MTYLPSSFFNRQLDTLAADQSPAQHLANQLNYGRQSGFTFQGYAGVGYGNSQWPYSLGFNGPKTWSHPVYNVKPSDPSHRASIQKVGLYFMSGGKPVSYAPGALLNLQSHLNAVPIPDKTLCPMITGTYPMTDIWAEGSGGAKDAHCFIHNVDSDEGYGFFELTNNYAAAQAVTGCVWTAQEAEYYPSLSNADGILPYYWGSRACSLGEVGGLITMQDLVDVFNGKPINHAIAIACPMNGGSGVAPAVRGDGPGPNGNNVPKIPAGFPGATGANPAYQHDVTFEGQRFRFPSGVDLSAVGYPLGRAIAGAIRDRGLVITDTSGAVAFYLEDMRSIGSPYNSTPNPFSLNWASIQQGTDPRWGALPTGQTVLHQLPWAQLQALDPIRA